MQILHTTRDDAVRKLAISALLRHCKQQPSDGTKVLLPFYALILQREKVPHYFRLMLKSYLFEGHLTLKG